MKVIKRKCIGCGKIKSRTELIKITKEYQSGTVSYGANSKIFGRSVYLCYNKNCIEMALKKKRLNKALKTGAEINKLKIESFLETN